jgi:hypothetical protein
MEKSFTLDWTDKHVFINDVRKIKKLYILKINNIEESLFVNEDIFEQRLKSYWIKDNISEITRENILSVSWDFYITKGYYIKIDKEHNITKINQDPNKYYVSYLDIHGPLSNFHQTIYSTEKIVQQLNS